MFRFLRSFYKKMECRYFWQSVLQFGWEFIQQSGKKLFIMTFCWSGRERPNEENIYVKSLQERWRKFASVFVSVFFFFFICYDSKYSIIYFVRKKISFTTCYWHINHLLGARLSIIRLPCLGMITHRVIIQWLYEKQHQTCITDSETPNAELLLLFFIIVIIISLGASAGCRSRAIWVYTDSYI